MCQTGEPVNPLTTVDAERRGRAGRVLHPLRRALSHPLGVAVAPDLGRQDPLVPCVDRVADRLADEVRADRPAAEPVPLEQLALRLHVAGIGDGPVDLEVISPAGELDTVEAPRLQLRGQVDERQVGPLAGEQGDGTGHLSLLWCRDGVMAMLAQEGRPLPHVG